jgi:Ni,Fe-hydrogenase III small subunit
MKTKRLSVAIYPLNMGGSNACRLELDAIFSPPYDAAKYGISLTSSPKQADIVLLFGSATIKAVSAVNRLLAQLPEDVKLVMLGSESSSATPFKEAYGVAGPLVAEEKAEADPFMNLVLPKGKKITAYIAGSPPDPQTIIDGILEAARL